MNLHRSILGTWNLHVLLNPVFVLNFSNMPDEIKLPVLISSLHAFHSPIFIAEKEIHESLLAIRKKDAGAT